MSYPQSRLTKLCAVLFGLGLATGVSAQGTSKDTTTSKMPGATQSTKQDGGMASGDRKFVEKAASGGMLEVQLGQMAQQKASNDQVKQFGSKMAEEHGKANDELKQIATSKGAQIPATLEKDQQKEVQKLEKLSGAEFDRAYMKRMVSDHKDDVSAFEKESKSGKDAELKSFAAKTLPTLQEHQKLAQTTYDAVKNTKKSMGSSSTKSNDSSSSMPSGKPSTKSSTQ